MTRIREEEVQLMDCTINTVLDIIIIIILLSSTKEAETKSTKSPQTTVVTGLRRFGRFYLAKFECLTTDH